MSSYDGTWEIDAASARASTPGKTADILVTIQAGSDSVALRPTPLEAIGLAQLLMGVAIEALANAGRTFVATALPGGSFSIQAGSETYETVPHPRITEIEAALSKWCEQPRRTPDDPWVVVSSKELGELLVRTRTAE